MLCTCRVAGLEWLGLIFTFCVLICFNRFYECTFKHMSLRSVLYVDDDRYDATCYLWSFTHRIYIMLPLSVSVLLLLRSLRHGAYTEISSNPFSLRMCVLQLSRFYSQVLVQPGTHDEIPVVVCLLSSAVGLS